MEELSRIKRLGRKVTIDWKPWRPATSEEKLNNLKRKKKLRKWVTHIRDFSTDSREGYSIALLSHFFFVIFIIFFVNRLLMLGHDKVLMLIKCLFFISFTLLIIFTLKLHLVLVVTTNSSCGLFMFYFYLFMIFVVLIHI